MLKVKETAFTKWLNRYVSEAGLDLDFTFEVEGGFYGTNYIPLEVVLEAICNTPAELQRKIKKQIVWIDFNNADPMEYFRGFAEKMAI